MTFQEIINQDTPVLVDFFATWCGPCQTMAPVLEQLKQQVGNHARVLKIDVDKSPQAASTYHVQGVPTFIVFKNGKVVWRQSGVRPLSELLQVLYAHSG